MTLLRPNPVSLERFHFLKEENLLVAEISDLGVDFSRVWNDACDEGITVVSHHTGREVVYAVNALNRDSDGDTTHWDLTPARRSESHLPTIRVFND